MKMDKHWKYDNEEKLLAPGNLRERYCHKKCEKKYLYDVMGVQ